MGDSMHDRHLRSPQRTEMESLENCEEVAGGLALPRASSTITTMFRTRSIFGRPRSTARTADAVSSRCSGDPIEHTAAIARAAYHALQVAGSVLCPDVPIKMRVSIAHTTLSNSRSPAPLLYHAIFESAVVSAFYDHQFAEWARDHIAFIEVMTSVAEDRGRMARDFRLFATELRRPAG